MNGTLLDMVRSMLRHKNAAECLRAGTHSAATYVRNRDNSRALPVEETPHRLWKGLDPVFIHLRDFGLNAGKTPFGSVGKKLDNRSLPVAFIGYAEKNKAFKLLDKKTHAIVVSRDVFFEETAEWSPASDLSSIFVTSHNHQSDLEIIHDWKLLELEDNVDLTTTVQSGHKCNSKSEDNEYESENVVDGGDEHTPAQVNEQHSDTTDNVSPL